MSLMDLFGSDRLQRLPEFNLVLGISALLMVGSVMGTSSLAGQASVLPVMGLVMHRLVSVMRMVSFLLRANSTSFEASGLSLLNGTMVLDSGSQFAKMLLRFSTAACRWASAGHAVRLGRYAFEYPLRMALATLGLMVMVSANDLIVRYLGLEWQSLCLYVLAAFRRGSAYSTEAGLKYFIMGAVASGFYLFGASLIYGATGSINFSDIGRRLMGSSSEAGLDSFIGFGLAMVLSAFMFKLAVAPFHAWAPDVYEGSPLPSTLYFAVVPKLAMVRVVARLCVGPFAEVFLTIQPIRLVGSVASRLVAALSARVQRRLKRFRSYSAIGHMGYVFLGLSSGSLEGVQASMIYRALYIVMSIVSWVSVLSISREVEGDRQGEGETIESAKYITDLTGLSRVNPFLAMTVGVTVRSMAGIPPLAGFMAKMWVFFAAMSQSLVFFSVFAVLTSCVGAFYYRRWVKVMYFEGQTSNAAASFQLPVDSSAGLVLGSMLGVMMVVMVLPGPLRMMTHRMALAICA